MRSLTNVHSGLRIRALNPWMASCCLFRLRRIRIAVLGLAFVLAICIGADAAVVYVDSSNTAAPWDGTQANPFNKIQDGIDAAVDGDTVLVADGTYTSDGNRDLDFKGKAITVTSEKGVEATIIDCEGTSEDNHRGFHFHSGETSSSVLDGFTIKNGYIHPGAGIYCSNSDPIIKNCEITENTAEWLNGIGGGCYFSDSFSEIINCRITFNSAIGTSPHSGNGWGGGIAIGANSNIKIKNSQIMNNYATYSSGGVGVHSSLSIVNSVISDNSSQVSGGFGFQDSNSTIMNCTITENDGWGIYHIRSNIVVVNSILWGNSIGAIDGWGGSITITYSDIQGGWPGEGNIDVDPLFVDVDPEDGDYHLLAGSSCIDAGTDATGVPSTDKEGHSRVDGNLDGRVTPDIGAYEYLEATAHGPYSGTIWYVSTTGSDETGDGSEAYPFATIQEGIDAASSGDTVFVREGMYNEFVNIPEGVSLIGDGPNKTIISYTGSVVLYAANNSLLKGVTVTGSDNCQIRCDNSSPTIMNNIITGKGVGIATKGSAAPLIINNTIADHENLGIWCLDNSKPIIRNNIIVNNWFGIGARSTTSPVIAFNNVWNNTKYGDYYIIDSQTGINGNISVDPLFVDPANGDYDLQPSSPCIDAGDPSSPLDPDGTRANMGVLYYEQSTNNSPVSDAGPDQSVAKGETVTLDGSGSSDPKGDPLTYTWSLDPENPEEVRLSDATAVQPTFTSTVAGTYRFVLVVNVGAVDSAPDTVAVTVTIASPVELFTDSGQSFGSPYTGDVLLGDLDNDGDIDLVEGVLGWTSPSTKINKVYFNDGTGIFSDSGQNLGSSKTQGLALGDIDNDGDLDLVAANNGPNRIYINDSNGIFTDSGQSIGAFDTYIVALGDIDNDGDIDLVSGNADSQANKIYINDGTGTFFDSAQNIGSSITRYVILRDIDNDGDFDLVAGNYGANKVYMNDGTGSFTDSGQNIGSSNLLEVALGDVDKDGDLDLVEGVFYGDSTNRVYLNDGAGIFTDSGQELGSYSTRSIVLGDIDNDGDLDLLTGNKQVSNRVYLNDGTGIFSDSGFEFGSDDAVSLCLADIDGDGDLDLVEGNYGGGASISDNKIYINNVFDSNIPPMPPTLLETVIDNQNVTLSWDNGSDTQTSPILLTYNLRIGTTPGGNDILSGVIPAGPGNIGHMLSHTTKNLPSGTYYWSVQTVDTGFEKSPWAVQHTFLINALTGTTDLTITETTDNYTGLLWTDVATDEWGYRVEMKAQGEGYVEIAVTNANATSFAATNLKPETTYFFRIRAYNHQGRSDYSNEISGKTQASVLSLSPYRPLDLVAGDFIRFKVSGGDAPYTWVSSRSGVGNIDQAGVFEAVDKGGTVVTVEDANGYQTASELILVSTGEPAAPGDLTAEVISPTQVDLTWRDYSDDESGFTVEYRPSDGDWVELWSLPRNVAAFSAAGLKSGTAYFFRVQARNAYGVSEYSNPATAQTMEVVITLAPDESLVLAPGEYQAFEAEGGTGAYTWTSSNPGVGTVDVGGIFTAKAEGAAVVLVEDAAGNRASSGLIEVDASLPYPPSDLEAMAMSTTRINLTWVDQADNEHAFQVEMRVIGGDYQTMASLPRNSTTATMSDLTENTTYFFRVRAQNPNGPSKPSNEFSVKTLAEVSPSIQVPGGMYQMISLPFTPDKGNAQLVLEDDLGPYDQTRWRLGHWKNGAYQEYPEIDPFVPGRAFWLILSDPDSIGTSGVSTDPTRPYRIPLQPGWNQVGDPFNEEMDWSATGVEKEGTVFPIAEVSSTGVENRLVAYVAGGYEPTAKMEPWSGYWVKNTNASVVQLVLPSTEGALAKSASPAPSPRGWAVQVKAYAGGYRDTDNRLGQWEGATQGADWFDYGEPPTISPSISAYFILSKGEALHSYDYRPLEDSPCRWDLAVRVEGMKGEVDLHFEGLDRVPEGWMLSLTDRKTGEQGVLTPGAHYRYRRGEEVRRFYVDLLRAAEGEHVSETPDRVSLYANVPNPFNRSTTLLYGLPRESSVRLVVYDLVGQQVRVLVDAPRWAGTWSVRWDGRDDAGREVASGIYISQLKVGSTTSHRTMLLLK